MPSLSDWKVALEANGIEVEFANVLTGIYDELVIRPHGHCLFLYDDSDDHSAAEFVSRVTAKVFGEWAHIAPEDTNDDDFYDGWALCVGDGVKGSGTTKLDALYDALTKKVKDA